MTPEENYNIAHLLHQLDELENEKATVEFENAQMLEAVKRVYKLCKEDIVDREVWTGPDDYSEAYFYAGIIMNNLKPFILDS